MQRKFTVLIVQMFILSGFIGASFIPNIIATNYANFSEDWWNENWHYRIHIPVDPSSSGAQTNYQKMLTVHYDSGVNHAGELYCNQHCKNDFGDIRFTEANGTELDYWIEEKVNGEYIKIWIELPVISDFETLDYYMYYGNPSAVSMSNGKDTFLLFDDFNDETIDPTLWRVIRKGSNAVVIEETGGLLHLTGEPNIASSANIKSMSAFNYDFSIEFMRKADQEYFRDISIGNGPIVDAYAVGNDMWWHTTFTYGYIVFINSDNAEHLVTMNNETQISYGVRNDPIDHGAFHRNTIFYLENGDLEHWVNGTQIIERTDLRHKLRSKYIMLSQGEHLNGFGGNSYYDWIFVRNFITPDPIWSTPGAEESNTDNLPPIISDEKPIHMSENVSVYLSEISFTVADPNDDNVTYKVTANPDFIGGTQSGTVISDTTVQIPRANGLLAKDTTYVWWVNVTDGKVWTNTSYSFTTVDEIFDGYTLFTPGDVIYLIDRNGEIVHSWLSEYPPSLSVYMMENGSIIRPCTIFDSEVTRWIQKFTWNGTMIWNYQFSGEDYWQHHDIEPLPNGNVLILADEVKTYNESIAAGRDPDLILHDKLHPTIVVEVKPTGPTSGEIVWEWHLWDHLIQDFNSSKDNYGVVEDHPELVDINFCKHGAADWIHANTISYNYELDQVMLCSRYLNEIWVIDHSTTTEEAAGHTGGNSGKGGDILYRWGNPRSYRAGDENDQKLFGPHDATWIQPGCPGEGNILIFNNGIYRPVIEYSSVDEFTPPMDANGNYILTPGEAYGPENLTWQYTAENPEDFYAAYISGCERLPNGNTLIIDGPIGFLFEVNMDGDIVWSYNNIYPQNDSFVFKARQYYTPFCPPVLPSITGPTDGTTGVEYEYTFKSTDLDGDDVYYYIDWGDEAYEEWIGPYNSGEEITIGHTWETQDTYNIRCRVKDSYDSMSNWSTLMVNINGGNNPPIVFDENPINMSENVSVYLSEISFTVTDPEDDPISYTITASPDFIGGQQNGIVETGGTIHIPRFNGMLDNDTTYVLWVNVTDGLVWTNKTYSFTTVSEIFDGYTLFTPKDLVYLVDKNGEIVHTWQTNGPAGLGVYMVENGSILRPCQIFETVLTKYIQKITWNGTMIWNFQYSDETYWQHHDIEPLPNGNVLLLANEVKTYNESIAAGRDPSLLWDNELWPAYIVEVKPTGPTSGEIVWEWHLWDHLIQDFNSSKDNYGVVEDHPELVDINFAVNGIKDWIHANTVSYNQELDQVMISSRNLNEFWIVDHSTTTEEAAGHTGGNSGKGGDILYRWGNPRSYRAGDENDQTLFGQHDTQWIQPGYPGEGNILIFNNGHVQRNYSSIDEITPPVDANGSYELISGEAYGPENLTWQYTAENPQDFYSSIISGCERLPNGNTIICEGTSGFLFEVTPEGEIVWSYLNTYPENGTFVFKTRRYYSPFCPPVIPSITGPTDGTTGIEYEYAFETTDPDGDDVYYYIDWGDGSYEEWIGPYNSGEEITIGHSWETQDTYIIQCRTKDSYDSMSNWKTLTVNMI